MSNAINGSVDTATAQPTNRRDGAPGVFVFSLDTELAWGYFDKAQERSTLFTPDGHREQSAIRRVLEMLQEYEIVGTWALVGHLFFARCEQCDPCPIAHWQGRHSSFDQIYGDAHPLWYMPDLVDRLADCNGSQEIAFHGLSHEVFGEESMSPERAAVEIGTWLDLATLRDIHPTAVVFPRNRAGHKELLAQADFICYRGEESQSIWTRNRYFGGLLKTADHLLGLSTAPTYPAADLWEKPLLDVRSSQHLFAFNRRVDLLMDRLGLSTLRLRRLARAVHRAAARGHLVHAWVHPWEFRTEADFAKLRYLLEHVRAEMEQGRMLSMGMSQAAGWIRDGAGVNT